MTSHGTTPPRRPLGTHVPPDPTTAPRPLSQMAARHRHNGRRACVRRTARISTSAASLRETLPPRSDERANLEQTHVDRRRNEVGPPIVRELDGEKHPDEVALPEEEPRRADQAARLVQAEVEGDLVERAVVGVGELGAAGVDGVVGDEARVALRQRVVHQVARRFLHRQPLEVFDRQADGLCELRVGERQARRELIEGDALGAAHPQRHLVPL
mmetsp:Transcript_4503/g.10389  ORF Transcript_4503/g.10389 Transcript_4503/m.10389 type:complete len:214 (-) Transcript_4503:358-999(-)